MHGFWNNECALSTLLKLAGAEISDSGQWQVPSGLDSKES